MNMTNDDPGIRWTMVADSFMDTSATCGGVHSETVTLDTGAPQGCALSPLMFSYIMERC